MLSPNTLFTAYSEEEFEMLALQIFRFQAENNRVYKRFLDYLNINPLEIVQLAQIPFLPISFFKNFEIISGAFHAEKIFTSSGTTGDNPSRHFVKDINLYHKQLEKSFKHFYGDFEDFIIFPLLPAYAERSGSSLIEMVDFWMSKTGQLNPEYYLYNHEKLAKDLIEIPAGKQAILIGVSFALLDFAANFSMDLSKIHIIETGGMKGRKTEITRKELHEILKNSFQSKQIESEYGMTELLSQAYARKDGLFATPPWMKIILRDPEDPFSMVKQGKTGGINVIDFANIHSCSFIATDDLGRYHAENQLEIMGRFDNSDVRGCNLMAI
ncbi:MAG: acyl transferase [Flavobacteriaceae bacterium]|nr:acyl transferase [Flavobacteriaceae bacterium]